MHNQEKTFFKTLDWRIYTFKELSKINFLKPFNFYVFITVYNIFITFWEHSKIFLEHILLAGIPLWLKNTTSSDIYGSYAAVD